MWIGQFYQRVQGASLDVQVLLGKLMAWVRPQGLGAGS